MTAEEDMISDRPTGQLMPVCRANTVKKKSSNPFDLAAPGSVIPASELKSASYCWPIKTEI